MVLLEPTGPDILVGRDSSDTNTARWLVGQAYLTPIEPGRKPRATSQSTAPSTSSRSVRPNPIRARPLCP